MSERYLGGLLNDRSRALRPKAVLQGINTGDMRGGCKEMENVMMILHGYYTEMEMDGADLRTKVGIMLVRARSIVDTLETMNSRLLHDRDGVIV